MTLVKFTGKQATAIERTIALNNSDTEIDRARFDYQAKLFALQQEFNVKRDALRTEYLAACAAAVAEIISEA
jgi:hypothetical protein